MKSKFQKLLSFLKNREETSDHTKWLLALVKPYKKQVLIALLINIFSLVLSLSSTIVGKYVVDAAIHPELLLRFVVVMGVTTLISIAFGAVTKIFSEYVSEKFSFGIRCNMFDSIQRSAWRDLSKFHSGDLVTRLTSDVGTVSSNLMGFFPTVIVTFLQLVLSFAILFYFDRPLALFALLIGPIGAFLAMFFREKYKAYQTRLRESESQYRSFMQESLSNITVVKTFQRENENSALLGEIRKSRMVTVMDSARLSATMSAAMRFVYSAGYVTAFCWGAYRLSKGQITYGTMTIFISLVSQVQGSISGLAQVIPQFYSMIVSAKRIREVSDIENEDYTRPDGPMPQQVGVQIKNVDFTYETEQVLSDVSLSIAPGEHVGIVGSSGAGKTTLIRLLLALVSPDSGSITYTTDVADEAAIPASRRFISYVPQGNTLLSGTIERNLRIGKVNATDEEIENALELAGAADFVRKLPDGINTVLSEHAGGLSEGQAQRISIARALLRDAPLLILDEATSALDEMTEARVLERITSGCSKTCLIITHRRSMLKYCDAVLEITDDGHASVRDT